jgi:hypothetical protein
MPVGENPDTKVFKAGCIVFAGVSHFGACLDLL